MAMTAGRISRIPCIPNTRTECVERSTALGNAKVGAQNLSLSCRMSVRRGIGRRSALIVIKAVRASSGDRTDKQREEIIPSSPPLPSTTTNSVEVPKESDEKDAYSEAAVDDQLAAESTSGEAGSVGSESSTRDKTSNADSVDEIGKELSELRRERAALGSQDPAGTTDFWRGVAEETSLIDWPVFSKVLGTTGVVVAMIFGSSIVLLTVNAILAATSDVLFNDPAIRELVKPQ